MCADPRLRGELLAELRAEWAARRQARAGDGAGRWRAAAWAVSAPLAAVVLIAFVLL